MKKLFLLLVIAYCYNAVVNAQIGARVTHGFWSMCPPRSWETSVGGFLGPVEQGVNTTVTTKMNVWAKSRAVNNLKEYVDEEFRHLESAVISRSSFKTNSGITGEKVVFRTGGSGNDKNTILNVHYFFFREKEMRNCVVIECSVLESKSSKYLAIFDESAKTFMHINK